MKKAATRFLIGLIFALFPLAAHAWTLNTWVKSAGGYMTSPNYAGNQTSTNGSLTKTYTTTDPLTVSVVPNSGYYISNLTKNGVIQTLDNSQVTQTFQVSGPSNQSVYATFLRIAYTLTGSASSNGSVSPASITPVYAGTQSPAKVFTFTPAPGYCVQSISVPGHVLNTDYQLFNATTGALITLPAPTNVNVKVSIVKVKSSVTVSGQFVVIGANAGASQTVQPGATVILDGSASTGASSYNWTRISGPAAVTLSGETTSMASFTAPATVGTYQFQLSINSGASVSTTTVYVTNDPVAAARTQCQNCHDTTGVGVAANVLSNWAGSRHVTGATSVMCYHCHTGANTGGHPGPALSSLANVCRNCHTDASGAVPGHPFPIGTFTCVRCHNAHTTVGSIVSISSAHYNNMTSAGYPASYVKLPENSNCANCHYENQLNATVRNQWAGSGHAAVTDLPWTMVDFKTRSDGCVQCHTTTGFVAYSTGTVKSAWGVASDKNKEVLACNGCHSDITTGVVRSVAPVRPFANDSYLNRDVGASNICMTCHSGTNTGASIVSADFTSQGFIAPHNLAAGGVLHAKAAYRFPGRSYVSYSSNSHRVIGSGNRNATGSGGPCVGCHMSSTEKHLFSPVRSGTNGALTGITSTACANCHGTSLVVMALADYKSAYGNSIGVLQAMLNDKGFVYTSSAPFFSNTNWGEGQAGANIMGAAYNYVLFRREPGAYAHNAEYARQLIIDSIDALYNNGTVTGSIDNALSYLVGKGAITATAADSLAAYKESTSCATCHTHTSASHPAHFADGLTCTHCHTNTANTANALVPGTLQHLNGLLDVVFSASNSKIGANYAASTCSNITCHGNGPVTWGSGPVTCLSCHSGTLSVINGRTAPDKTLAASSGHGRAGIALQCLDCHDQSKQHFGGAGRLQTALTGTLNNDCNYCHNDPAKVTNPSALAMSTHFVVGGGEAACKNCHDPHGSTNQAMIRTSILGQAITYADSTTGFVDLVTNRGLCQVCHTITNHYRAGVAETNHPTSGCLNCHSHNSPGGAFRPVGGACDSCHGYPPARRYPVAGFGMIGTWESARYEDYSGGGGAHLLAQHVAPTAKATEGWSNCTICHNGGRTSSAPYHKMTTPVSANISNVHIEVDPKYRFSNSLTIYTSARLVNPPAANVTGVCFNISCHMTPSPRWSTER